MNPEEHGIKFVGGAPVMFDDMQKPEMEEPMRNLWKWNPPSMPEAEMPKPEDEDDEPST